MDGQTRPVTEWIYFIHPPRDDFAATMTADEQAARQIMEEDPVVRGGYARGEVRPFRVSLLRGRD
jgi:hypothetical protein